MVKCSLCGLMVTSQDELSEHKGANHDLSKCDLCEFSAEGSLALKAHKQAIHVDILKEVCFVCVDCEQPR